MTERDVMPAGAMIPEAPEEAPLPEEAGQDQSTEQGAKGQGEQTAQEELILGKFKSQDDLAKAYKELESMSGRQSSDVGDLRKQNELLVKQLELLHQHQGQGNQQAKEQPAEPSFDDRLAQISQQVEEGEIDISQALKLTSEITAQKALHLQKQEMAAAEQQKQVQTYQQKFLEENPDFSALQQDGTLQQIRAQNPWLYPDDVAAYHGVQIQRLQGQIDQEKQTAYQQGRSDVTKLAEGSEAARKVLAKPGADIRRAGNSGKPLSDSELRASMLSRVGGG